MVLPADLMQSWKASLWNGKVQKLVEINFATTRLIELDCCLILADIPASQVLVSETELFYTSLMQLCVLATWSFCCFLPPPSPSPFPRLFLLKRAWKPAGADRPNFLPV